VSRWWRAYDEAVDDPKLCLLTDRQHRAWFNLCCITSQNGGVLPSIDAIAFKLRMTPLKAKAIVSELQSAGLIDDDGNGDLSPHNWGGRQFQSDGSTDRVKRFRERKRNVSPAVSETPPDTEADTEQKDDDAEDAGARPPLIRPEAFEIANEIAGICGYDLEFVPPEWHGAPLRVEVWLAAEWPREIILAAVKGALAKKRGPPPSSINYFEKPIAEAVAKASAPLPKVNLIAGETIDVRTGNGQGPSADSSSSAAARRLVEQLREWDTPAERSEGGGGAPRLLSAR
jgi:hypothetical protein